MIPIELELAVHQLDLAALCSTRDKVRLFERNFCRIFAELLQSFCPIFAGLFSHNSKTHSTCSQSSSVYSCTLSREKCSLCGRNGARKSSN